MDCSSMMHDQQAGGMRSGGVAGQRAAPHQASDAAGVEAGSQVHDSQSLELDGIDVLALRGARALGHSKCRRA